MDGLRNWKKRFLFSVTVGMMAALIFSGVPQKVENRSIIAWWGTLYPRFCFEETDNYENTVKQPPKLSFWLAKALERW